MRLYAWSPVKVMIRYLRGPLPRQQNPVKQVSQVQGFAVKLNLQREKQEIVSV